MKDLIRSRHQVDMYYNMGSQLKAMSLQLGTIKATASISSALKSATTTMTHVNESMDIKQIQKVIKEFTKQQAKMENNQEVVFSERFFNFINKRSVMLLKWVWIVMELRKILIKHISKYVRKWELN